VKRADFLAVNTDWGRGAISAFGDMLKRRGAVVGAAEFMDQAATDMNAQLAKIKGTGGDTLFLTTAVEQITLVMKQAQEQRGASGDALGKLSIGGANAPLKFGKAGPAGKESGQSKPSIFLVQIKDGKVASPW